MKKLPSLLALLAVSGIATFAGLFSVASAQTPESMQRKAVFAPIESVEVFQHSASPTSHALKVVAGLPGGCAQPLDYGVNRFGDIFVGYVLNSMPADDNTPCTRIYGTYESTLDLGTNFVPGKEYTAYVNDKAIRFVANGGIVPAPDRVVRPAPIESVHVVATASLPAQYQVNIVAGLPGGCAQPGEHLVTFEGNTVNISVNNFEPAGDAICTAIYGTYPLSFDLGGGFASGHVYTVNVNGTTMSFTAF